MQTEFEKDLLQILSEEAAKKTLELRKNNVEFMDYDRRMEELFHKIELLLPKEDNGLIDEFVNAKSMVCCFEEDVFYLQGMRDGVKLLRMMEVL